MLSNPQAVAEVVKKVSPETLVVLDAVCAVASEEIQMDSWGIDVVITASQKGLGAPPGLSIVVVSQKALKVGGISCVGITSGGVDRFHRSLRHARNRSPRSMRAGRGKSIRVSTQVPYSPYRRWLPIMKGYEGGTPAYFATPPVNLIHAYHQSLSQIVKASPSLDERLKLHRETSSRIKAAAKDLGLSQLPFDTEIAANGMTAVSQ